LVLHEFAKCVSPVRHDQQNLGRFLLRTDTRLVFCNRKLMRTDIFFTRTTKPILKVCRRDEKVWRPDGQTNERTAEVLYTQSFFGGGIKILSKINFKNLRKIYISCKSTFFSFTLNKCKVFLFNGDKSCPLLMKDRHVWEVG
jgi:hypothetical protein